MIPLPPLDTLEMALYESLEHEIEEIPEVEDLMPQIELAAYKAAQEAKEFWYSEAARNLKSTRQRYQRAIYVYEDFEEGIVVGLDKSDELIAAIEDGAPPFDMKKGLLKNAAYQHVPMRGGNLPNTFRTVSKNMGADDFMHPGWAGLHLQEIVEEE